jgi:hypothetical protein
VTVGISPSFNILVAYKNYAIESWVVWDPVAIPTILKSSLNNDWRKPL